MKEIKLTRGYIALVDDEDAELVAGHHWHAFPCGQTVYARTNVQRNGNRTTLIMHRLILGFPSGDVDHRNHNGLDNRRENLRACSRTENCWNRNVGRDNTSGHKGVSWHRGSGKWYARIWVGGKRRGLGYFKDKSEAAAAYNKAAHDLHGDFAYPPISHPPTR